MLRDPDDSSDDCWLNVDTEDSLCWQSSAADASQNMKPVYKRMFERTCEEIYLLRAKLDSLRAAAEKDTAAAEEYIRTADTLVSHLLEKNFFSLRRDPRDLRTDIQEVQKDLCKMRQSVSTAELEAVETVEATASNALQAASNKHKRPPE